MAEQRLIDANKLIEKCENLYMRGHVLFHGVTAFTIENAPTIDPETLPIVRQLRAELARVTEEKKAIAKDFEEYAHGGVELCKYCMFDEECEPGETKCDAFGTGVFKYRGPQKEE